MGLANDCWVLIECPRGRIPRESMEALSAARSLQRSFPCRLVAVWAGPGPEDRHEQELASLGVEHLLRLGPIEGPILGEEDFLARLRELHAEHRPDCVVIGATPFGRDLAPRLAVLERAGHLPRVTYLRRVGDRLQFTRALVRGKLSEVLGLVSGSPAVVTPCPGAFPLPRVTRADRSPAPPHGDLSPPGSTPAPAPRSERRTARRGSAPAWEVLVREEEPLESLDLEDADVVVAGGKGMGSAGNFALLQELASLLGGTVAASRIAVDLGWAGKDRLVGQTGRKISPELYIACGISGAPQHRAGLRDCRYLLAINSDPEAPIFRHATWSVVGDALRVLPEWIRLLKEERG